MKLFAGALKIGTIIGTIALIGNCQEEKPEERYQLPEFKNVSERLIQGNLEFPSGITCNIDNQKHKFTSIKGINSDIAGFFVECPLFQRPQIGDITIYDGSLVVLRNPRISYFSGTIDNLIITPLSEFDLGEYPSDFDSFYYPSVDSLWRPKGLILDDLVLDDGSVLTSSNSSDRIFVTNSLGQTEIFLQGQELERITDMTHGSNGKIYAVQAPLIDEDGSLVLSPKKVISIDNKIINKEFEIPYKFNSGNVYLPNCPNYYKEAPLLEKLKIVENSEVGKEKFGAEFYVSDLLGDVIYKVDNKNNISILAQGLRYPSSLAVDSLGNIYYTSSPLWDGGLDDDIKYPASLYVLNPTTGESKLVYEFGGRDVKEYIFTGLQIEVKYNNIEPLVMPVAFNVSNILYESATRIDFLLSNSHQGTLKWVTLEKDN